MNTSINSRLLAALSHSTKKCYSTASNFNPLLAKNLKITKSTNLKPLVPNKDLIFGHTFTDHMIIADYTNEKGWETPELLPYGKLSLDPASAVFHYAFECFEGMKAYKGSKGELRLFRPDLNMARLSNSSQRLSMPAIDGKETIELIKELVKIDERWIPTEKGYSLYIRPTVIGTQEYIGVGPSNSAKLFVITCPVGPYYRTGFKAVSLLATTDYVRAWPGGTGGSKIGANYGPCIVPQIHAMNKGSQQNLWLFGPEDELSEVGTMNCFVLLKNKSGEVELVTPPLDGTILPGVTRSSILGLARQWGEFKVSERRINMKELEEALKENRVIEMFGSGTACIVSPIREILYQDRKLTIPLDPKDSNAQAGPYTKRFFDTILAIQHGEIESEWSVVI
ncbi:branched-chain amino acid aminotransferase II [Neoconidiobolus thromboides FSU 785]|nr:branched-chain amino acid aminotransferase II [Neoconidiobolus thromboides FSU 785]